MTDPDKVKKVEAAHVAFVRWQEVSRTHLGQTVNLVLTLTTAILGFAVSLAVNQRVTRKSPSYSEFYLSVEVLLGAVALGLATNLSRLWDFRCTTRAARGREMQLRSEIPEVLTAKQKRQASERENFGEWADVLGEFTWYFLLAQLLAFLVGVLLLACSVRQV